ncbi:TPA: hypothetical protein EYP66_20430 [Candidatus Poribacteria bacterium]|nr:hypothetical protein [Candidatus Poribacteria bacterium]
MNGNRSKKAELGEIWATKSEPCLPGGKVLEKVESPRDVVILLDDKDAYDRRYPDVRVAPISTETQNASNRDLILESKENPLGKRIMIELWNSQPMLKMNLAHRLSKLSEEVIEQLDRLNQKVWGFEVSTEGIKTGPSIIDINDPRLIFQENEIEATRYLRGPANYLLELWEQEAEEEESILDSLIDLIRRALIPPPIPEVALATTPENIPVTVLEESGESGTVHFNVTKKLTINENGRVSIILKAPEDENFDERTIYIRLNEIEFTGTIRRGIAVIRYDVPEDVLPQIHSIIAERQAEFPIELPIDQVEITLEP